MSYRVRFVNPQEHYRRLKAEIDHAIIDTLTKGDLVYRGQLAEFERELAAFVGTRHAVGVASGYHALHLSLVAAGIGPGDEVITAGHTFVATVSAIVHAGATPILVDIASDYNIDVEQLKSAVTPKTKAIIPVHLNGRVSGMDVVNEVANEFGLAVIEDAAQALGATFGGRGAGSIGTTGCFSFYPFKILGGIGDGGAVTTDDDDIARRISLLRYNGEDRETGEYHGHGYTALLDNVGAAVLSVKLKHVRSWIEHRRAIAAAYRERLTGVGDLRLPHFDEDNQRDIFQNYVIRTSQRDPLRAHLDTAGVETLIHWQKPMWRHAGLELDDPGLAETEAVCREVISLPMSAETSFEDVAATAMAIAEYFA